MTITPREILIATHVDADATRSIGDIVDHQLRELDQAGFMIISKKNEPIKFPDLSPEEIEEYRNKWEELGRSSK